MHWNHHYTKWSVLCEIWVEIESLIYHQNPHDVLIQITIYRGFHAFPPIFFVSTSGFQGNPWAQSWRIARLSAALVIECGTLDFMDAVPPFIPLFIRFQPSKVVQDFFHPQYDISISDTINIYIYWYRM
jgi:hypothetical protein